MTRSTWMLVAGLGLALIAAGILGFGSTGTSSSAASSSDGTVVTDTAQTTLVEENGPGVLVVLAVPAVVVAIALGFRRRRVTLALGWLLFGCCVLGMMTVGLFLLPVAALLLIAGYLDHENGEQGVASPENTR